MLGTALFDSGGTTYMGGTWTTPATGKYYFMHSFQYGVMPTPMAAHSATLVYTVNAVNQASTRPIYFDQFDSHGHFTYDNVLSLVTGDTVALSYTIPCDTPSTIINTYSASLVIYRIA